MFKEIKETFCKPSAHVLALRELEDARRSLLEAHTQAEYWQTLVMYNHKRVSRLQQYVSEV